MILVIDIKIVASFTPEDQHSIVLDEILDIIQ